MHGKAQVEDAEDEEEPLDALVALPNSFRRATRHEDPALALSTLRRSTASLPTLLTPGSTFLGFESGGPHLSPAALRVLNCDADGHLHGKASTRPGLSLLTLGFSGAQGSTHVVQRLSIRRSFARRRSECQLPQPIFGAAGLTLI